MGKFLYILSVFILYLPLNLFGEITVSVAPVGTFNANYYTDGIDDQIEINNAINDVFNDGGGQVYLNPGVYTITSNIEVNSNINLKGSGRSSIIKLSANSIFNFAGIIKVKLDNDLSPRVFKVTLEDFTIDGNRNENKNTSDNKYGVYSECDQLIIQNLYIHDCPGYGLDPHSGKHITPTRNIIIANCIIEHCGTDGIVLDKVMNSSITGNICKDNDRNGINLCTSSQYNIVADNICENNGQYGFMIQNGSSNNTISNNIINGNQCDGICIRGVDNIIITNNLIAGNFKNGINIIGSSNCIISSNKLLDNAQKTENQFDEIRLCSYNELQSSFNSIVNNSITDSGLIRAMYAIREFSVSCNYNLISDNIICGSKNFIQIQGENSQSSSNICRE